MTNTLEFTYRDTVRYSDCDMHQHMNNAVYFTYMESARMAYQEALGMAVKPDLRSIPFILVHASCDYRAPAYVHDEIVVQVGVTDIGTTSFTMQFRLMRDADEALLAEGKTVLVMYDYDANKPVPVTDDLKQRVAQLQQQHASTRTP